MNQYSDVKNSFDAHAAYQQAQKASAALHSDTIDGFAGRGDGSEFIDRVMASKRLDVSIWVMLGRNDKYATL